MELTLVFLCAGFLASASATFHFKYTDCSTSPNKVFRFGNVTLNPDVIHIPGTETGSLDLDILQPISGHQIRVDIAIKKNVLFGFQDIPCFGNKNGNCSYDLCQFLSQYKGKNGTSHCPIQLEQNHFPCTCPFQPGHYHINPVTFRLKPLDATLNTLAHGDYKIHTNLIDTRTGEQVGCYDIQLSIDTGCTGLLCSIIG